MGLTPLHNAVSNENAPLIDYLIQMKADLEAPTITGETPIFLAGMYGIGEAVRTLVAARADVNCHNSNGSTPFHFATKYQQYDVAAFLVSKGAKSPCDARGCRKCRLQITQARRHLAKMRDAINAR